MNSERDSYRQILRSSSIMGGAAGLNYLIGLLRVKIVAMLLGPTGVGLLGLYISAMGFIGTVSGLGVGGSSVREVVLAFGRDDAVEAARTIRILRRACWATGCLGWLSSALLARPISLWLFGSTEQERAIAILGVTLLLGAFATGRLALLQGLRRIEDIARANVLGTLLGSVVAVAIYVVLGEAGVAPALVATAAINAALSYWFSRRIAISAVDLSWLETFVGLKRFVRLGVAFMWSAVLAAGLDALTRSVVASRYGIDSAGIYQAAWTLSGLFAGFILSAMGADYYPRLSAAIHDRAHAARLVNEQMEVGVLLALPGLLATLAFAPLIMIFFYTSRFLGAAELLPWMVLGVFGQVLSWPIGFIFLAKGAARLVFIVETIFALLQIGFLFFLVDRNGLPGAAQAFAATYALHIPITLGIARALVGFRWSSSVTRLVVMASGCICASLIVSTTTEGMTRVIAGGVVTLVGSVISVRGLAARLGLENKLTGWMAMIPGGGIILPKPKD